MRSLLLMNLKKECMLRGWKWRDLEVKYWWNWLLDSTKFQLRCIHASSLIMCIRRQINELCLKSGGLILSFSFRIKISVLYSERLEGRVSRILRLTQDIFDLEPVKEKNITLNVIDIKTMYVYINHQI